MTGPPDAKPPEAAVSSWYLPARRNQSAAGCGLLSPAALTALEHLVLSSIRYSFGDFTLDPRGVLTGPDGEVALRPRTFALLHALVAQADRVLTHDELLDQVWGVEHLSAGALKQAVSELRKALGDDSSQPRFVQTLPRRGYRFVAEVRAEVSAERPATVASAGAANRGSEHSPPSTVGTAEGRGGDRGPTPRPGLTLWRSAALVLGGALLAVVGLVALRPSVTEPAPTAEAVDSGAGAGAPSRPTAVVLGFRTNSEAERTIGARLNPHLSQQFLGSGTEQDVPFQLADRLRTELDLAADLETAVFTTGEMLSAGMVILGSLRLRADDELDLQIGVFDTRTGKIGAYAALFDVDPAQPKLIAARLVNELWEWRGRVELGQALNDLPPIGVEGISLARPLRTGLVVRRLRLSMLSHAESGAEPPPPPALAN